MLTEPQAWCAFAGLLAILGAHCAVIISRCRAEVRRARAAQLRAILNR
jgi:hypothetical protein